MTSVVWSPQSVRDLEAIHVYISEESVRYADLVVGRLVAAVERLQKFPESGRTVRSELTPPFESLLSGRTASSIDTALVSSRSPQSFGGPACFRTSLNSGPPNKRIWTPPVK